MVKVLYVCPFAHYSGHHPFVSATETKVLRDTGAEVSLLTFCGNIDKPELEHRKVLSIAKHPFIGLILQKLRKRTLSRWILMLLETWLTLRKAVKVYKREKYDIIHLRDGEPFVFLPYLVSLPYKNIRWAISLTSAIVFKPDLKTSDLYRRPFMWLYTLALYFVVNNWLWTLLYRFVLRRNSVILMPQNEYASEKFRDYQWGLFKSRVVCIELGVGKSVKPLSKLSARKKLGLPPDYFTTLSFGAPHHGKNLSVIFKAVSKCPNVFLVNAGTHTYSLGSNPFELAELYNLDGRIKIFNRYIPDNEHNLFFSAVDVAIMSYTKNFASTSSMMWEFARYGLPIISSDANILGDDVKRYGLGILFEAENSLSLANAIENYRCLSKTEIEKIKVNCGNFVASHSDKKWASDCISVYERLLNDKH